MVMVVVYLFGKSSATSAFKAAASVQRAKICVSELVASLEFMSLVVIAKGSKPKLCCYGRPTAIVVQLIASINTHTQ
jgi:hypothetical protein